MLRYYVVDNCNENEPIHLLINLCDGVKGVLFFIYTIMFHYMLLFYQLDSKQRKILLKLSEEKLQNYKHLNKVMLASNIQIYQNEKKVNNMWKQIKVYNNSKNFFNYSCLLQKEIIEKCKKMLNIFKKKKQKAILLKVLYSEKEHLDIFEKLNQYDLEKNSNIN